MANVNVTYQQMDDAGSQLTAGKGEMDDKLSTLKSLVDQLVNDGYVTDSSSKAFSQSYEEFTTGARQVLEGLDGMAKYLHTAAQSVQEADPPLANALKSCATPVSLEPGRHGGGRARGGSPPATQGR